MKRTPIYEAQSEAKAAFGDVEGWEMPKVFANIKAEYLAGKGTVGVADRSHLGRIQVTGAKRLDLLHRITTNHVKALTPGIGLETVMCTDKGRIIDDLIVYADETHFTLLTSPNMAGPVVDIIEKVRFRDDVSLDDVTDSTAMITLFGPEAGRLLEWVSRVTIKDLKLHSWRAIKVGSVDVVAARTHGIGGGGYNLIMGADDGNAVWRELFKEGESYGINPMGAEALEMLRVEYGVPSLGRELTDEFNPLEARLNDAIHWDKGCYTGQEVIARLDSRQKVQRLLVGYKIDKGDVPEPRSRVFVGDEEVGVVTSIVPSLELRGIIALGYIKAASEAPGTRVRIRSGGEMIGAEVSALPFKTPAVAPSKPTTPS
jgi:glycine cleavage system T protein